MADKINVRLVVAPANYELEPYIDVSKYIDTICSSCKFFDCLKRHRPLQFTALYCPKSLLSIRIEISNTVKYASI